jgi:uncharacterized protein
LAAVIHQVSNTFGEWHFYVLPAHLDNGRVVQSCDKAFFVSPFFEADMRYDFVIEPPSERVSVAIKVMRGNSAALTASFAGERLDLSDANILKAWAANPLMTLKVIVGIHWEAAQMIVKGVRYLGRTHPAQKQGLSALHFQRQARTSRGAAVGFERER